MVLSRWRLVAGLAVIGGLLGAAAALTQPKTYEAVSTLMVAQPKFITDAKPVNVASFRALFETNSLAASAIDQFKLNKPPYNLNPTRLQRDVLIVEEVRNTNLIRLHLRLSDAKVAVSLANFLASEGVEFNQRMDVQEGADFRRQLKTQLDDATARLRAAETKVLDFRRTAQVEVVKRDADSALDLRGELLRLTLDIESEKAKLSAAEREIQKQQRVFSIPRMVGTEAALRTATTEPAGNAARERAGSTATERAGNTATERAGNEVDVTNPFVNPVYQVLDYQIALSRTRLASLEKRRTELVNVQHLGGPQLQSLSAMYPNEMHLHRLEAEHDLAKTLYGEVAQQYERARLQIARSSAHLQVVDNAVEPDEPLPRHRVLYSMLGMMLGFVVALLVVATAHVGAAVSPETPVRRA
jgi:uncharacterized protein involved in exopolysaccharide biosynthesis